MDMTTFSDALAIAIRDSLYRSHTDEHDGVAGYCILLYCDLGTVGGISMSRSFADLPENEPALFVPVDWPTEHVTRAFDAASDLLARVGDGLPYETRVRALVEDAVEALQAVRSTDTALRDAILMVVCPDGSDLWDELETDALRRLNSAAVYEAWLAMLREARNFVP
ncbi:MAG: hypothetical protein J0L92_25555 [Deltaproteobacteria bacterium]|nr:hypothetical protein [Deltaproteobacteria bacterium]